ncbi:MAG: hypothetical protein ACRDNS_35960, partial [Trebonia sp.]
MDDSGGDGGVVAFPQVIEDFLVQCRVPAGAGGLDGGMSAAEDGDDVAGPVLDPAGEFAADQRQRWADGLVSLGPGASTASRRSSRQTPGRPSSPAPGCSCAGRWSPARPAGSAWTGASSPRCPPP